MVRRILAGQRPPLFYAGQHYGGTLEQLVQAAWYLTTGLPQNALTLRLPQVLLSVLTCALIWLVGVRILPTRGHATAAALVFAVGPWFNLVGTASSQGFYVVGQTLGILSWWLALKVGERSSLGRQATLLGLVTGLGLWTTATSVYFLVPALVWVIPLFGRRVRAWGPYLLGCSAGALPVAWQLVAAGRLPLQSGVPVHTSLLDRAHNLVGPVLREFLGVSYGHDAGGLPRPAQYAAAVGSVAVYAVAVWRRRSGLRDLLCGRRIERRPADLLLTVPPIVLLTYLGSSSTWYVGTPRYLLVAYPLLVLGGAAAVPDVRPIWGACLAGLATVVVAVLTIGFFGTQGRSWRDQEPELRQVLAVLAARDERVIRADYWTAMPLLYLANPSTRVGVTAGTVRFPDEQAAALAAGDPAYVVSRRDGSAGRLEAALSRRRATFRATTVGSLVIVDLIREPLCRGDRVGSAAWFESTPSCRSSPVRKPPSRQP